MRYGIIFCILAVLVAAMPMHKARPGEKRSQTLIHAVLTADQQDATKNWLDTRIEKLRKQTPLHQILFLSTGIILAINAAILVAYLINSIAAILGIGVSLAALLPLLVLAMVWARPRKTLLDRMKKHAEFGPFVSKWSTRMWKKRFRRAAREHGFAREF